MVSRMSFETSLARIGKLVNTLRSVHLLKVLIEYRVLAGMEHKDLFNVPLMTIIDIGANRGQFALVARHFASKATIIAFEPLQEPAELFKRIFRSDGRVILYNAAIGPIHRKQKMHVSAKDDSSSILPISSAQSEIFPGTYERCVVEVEMAPLGYFINKEDLKSPSLLKLDVQGFEYESLRGCETLLDYFDYIYCECSFIQLYSGQKLVDEVISWLSERKFRIIGVYNIIHANRGLPVQADFLFKHH